MKKIISNIVRVAGSNLLNAMVSMLITLILPKMLDVEQYGMYQLYIFYISYASYLCFGWPDGILLCYGGDEYEKLEFQMYKAQWIFYLIFISVIGVGMILISIIWAHNSVDKWILLFFTGMDVLIDLPKTYLRYILQATNKIKQYTQPLVMEKIGVILMFAISCLLKVDSYIVFIFVDLLGKVISLICSIFVCKEITFVKAGKYQIALSEGKENICVGIRLMITNITSMLIIGCVRFFIEYQWDVETFGKVSLTLSISNMLMIFIRAVGLVIFPVLRRVKQENLSNIYSVMRTVLMVILFGILGLYYPMRELLSAWLPQYADGLKYMAVLFPMCVFESKMSMIIEPYIKAGREEKKLLIINIVTVMVSICFSWLTAVYLHNLDLTIVIIIVLLAFRCICAELFITRILGLNKKINILEELIVTVVFCMTGWFGKELYVVLLYAVIYFVYLLLERKEIKKTIMWIRKYIVSGER